jgi:hypothetical protein
MTQLIDGIIHIADVPALVAFFAEHAPEKLSEDGSGIDGFDRTPTVASGVSALTYVRVTPEEETAFAAMPGVTVLARAEYTGDETSDAVYDALFADEDALALYDVVYSRAPVEVPDGDGGTITYTPPDRFGAMA